MTQTELNFASTDKVDLNPPYNGLFWCNIREKLLPWPEFISWYKAKRL